MRGPDAVTHFESLREQQDSIEKDLGESLDWRELPNRKSSSLRLSLKDVDPTQEDDWPRQIAWMAVTLTRFHATFARRDPPIGGSRGALTHHDSIRTAPVVVDDLALREIVEPPM